MAPSHLGGVFRLRKSTRNWFACWTIVGSWCDWSSGGVLNYDRLTAHHLSIPLPVSLIWPSDKLPTYLFFLSLIFGRNMNRRRNGGEKRGFLFCFALIWSFPIEKIGSWNRLIVGDACKWGGIQTEKKVYFFCTCLLHFQRNPGEWFDSADWQLFLCIS